MSDANNWGRVGLDARNINALTIPIGERINHAVATGIGQVFEIGASASQVVYVEVEVGTFRVRSGLLGIRTFTVDADADAVLIVGHPYSEDDGPLRVSSTTTLPAGLVADTDYWLIDVEEDSFRLALTRRGDRVGITDAGTGTHSIGGDNGPAATVGFSPIATPVVDVTAVGGKLLRTDEAQLFDAPVTLSAEAIGDTFTFWVK